MDKVSADREFFNTLGKIYSYNAEVTVRAEMIEGVRCYWFEPVNPKDDRIVIYLHGGAFIMGSIESHGAMVSHFASGLSVRILFVEYSLAPERPFPKAIYDVLNVYEALLSKQPEGKISVIGDSAGGGLAASFIFR